jgi:hypothetical protein
MYFDMGLGSRDYEKHGEILPFFFFGVLTLSNVDSVAIALLNITIRLSYARYR